MSRLSLNITDEFHHKLKIFTAWKDISIKDFVIKAISRQIELETELPVSKNILSNETIQIIEDSRQGINVNSYNSPQEFLKHLDKLQEEAEQELMEESRINNGH